MLEVALKVLQIIKKNGYDAYIVGGFVRDYILGKGSSDVDIATNATPKQIKEIFPNSFLPNELYGSITVISDKIRFEITTFRKELTYFNNRKPVEIEYINDLLEDLKRRDFTINTLCMDCNGKIIDLLDGKVDIINHVIKTVGNSVDKFSEDALRILRAIRFATVLNFRLDNEVEAAIVETKKYLSNISYNRKKSELDKIFISKNAKYGVELLMKLGLDKELEIKNLSEIKLSGDLVGVWSSINVSNNYPFTKNEKDLIKKIKEVSKYNNLDKKVLYKYGPYVNSIAAINKGNDNLLVVSEYNKLPIKTRNDILITSEEIMKMFEKKPGKYISDVYCDLETKILNGELDNNNKSLKDYICKNYLGGLI